MVEVDEIAVERACYGDPVPLSRAEKRAAVQRLTELGLSGRQIAERLRTSRRAVLRHRATLRRLAA